MFPLAKVAARSACASGQRRDPRPRDGL